MTQKDLLYLEDAVKHENNLVSICEHYQENVADADLKTFFKSQIKNHENLKKKLLKTMEDLANE